ncbi:MAG TPA: anhydro-N-acetylmuramic acid kinase, partial [Deinococcales bacterium]|nr:anhydro-N-acetylmuramic acid kinase [Deinococcales bacterium]
MTLGDPTQTPRILGLMSGTSADGVDAVLLELPGFPPCFTPPGPLDLRAPAPRGRVLAHRFEPYPDEVREAVLQASRDALPPSRLAQLHARLGRLYAAAAAPLSGDADLIACHGQTVQHIPRVDEGRGWLERATLQLGDAAAIAEVTGTPVVRDCRPADRAAGGQAAPLVPWADRVLFAE